MHIEVIKRLVGSSVTVTLKNDDKASGLLTEVGDDYIVLGQMESVLESDAIQKIEKDNSIPSPLPNPTPNQTELDTNIETTDSANFDRVSEKLTEIENRFDTKIQATQIELQSTDLTFPAAELPENWRYTNVSSMWIQIKNQYENAQKINELNPKYGRIQKIVTQAKSLTERFPTSPTLKRALAYFCSLSDNWEEARRNYQAAAVQSEKANDWLGVAVSALKLNKEDLACYSLEKFFHTASIIDEPQAWSIYVNLLAEFNNLPAFRERCKTDIYKMTEEEIQILLETAIYLLKRTGTEVLAREISRKWIIGEISKSLLSEACQSLDGEPVESYHQFATFMEPRSGEKKKALPIIPQHLERISTVKQPVQPTILQKQKPQAQVTSRGDDLYREAERANTIERNLEKAEHLYRECLRRNIRPESATKDLAMVLVRLERPEEAVDLLEEYHQKVAGEQSWNYLLISVYQNAGQYEKAIPLLNNTLKQVQAKEKKAQIRWQIANAYIKTADYASAESEFRQVQRLRPDNITVQRNLAFCLLKQEHYDEAETILNQIQNTSPDAKTAELLEASERAREIGEFILDEDRIISGELRELSEFAKFFLKRCTFEAIPPERVSAVGKYTGSEKDVRFDIDRLEKSGREQGTRRPRARSNSYLTAARIYYDLREDRDNLYRYLCRSFASRGDAAVSENQLLDTAREWYCEALRVYGEIQDRDFDEQDAVNALARFLFSYLGSENIPTSPPPRDEEAPVLPQQLQYIGNTVEVVISNHPQKDKVFDAIGYLLRCRYAENRILTYLYNNPELQKESLNYLQKKGINIPDAIELLEDFVYLWQQLRDTNFNEDRIISTALSSLHNFQLTTSWLEDSIQRVNGIYPKLFFNLDRQRVEKLRGILQTALRLCEQSTSRFEDQDNLCQELSILCQNPLEEIEKSPTKLSVEDIYPIIDGIQKKVEAHRKWLHENRKPDVTFRLPEDLPWIPTKGELDVQIVVENAEGRMPADALKLVTQVDGTLFRSAVADVELPESLRGGEPKILTVPLSLTDSVLQEKAFSLQIHGEYKILGNIPDETPPVNLSIQLGSQDQFTEIDNPYAEYAGGDVVDKKEMFFGRTKLITDIASIIRKSASRCVLVYGQYRSGKSSVLHHLSVELQKDKDENEDLLILNLGDISLALDTNSQVAILYQILWCILGKLKEVIKQLDTSDCSSLECLIPNDKEFYSHPTPLGFFETIFNQLKQDLMQAGWGDLRVVLLIDEFQYIYDLIVADKLESAFMQHWKALLQRRYFSAVLVGQDVMPKFKDRFANEFGTTEDRRVTYLEPAEAKQLIVDPILIEGNSRYREQAVERILDLTGGSPYYIQIICNLLVKHMNDKRVPLVTEADVEQVKNSLVTGNNRLDEIKFHSFTKSGDTSLEAISPNQATAILKAIADNTDGPDGCPRHRIVCEPQLDIDNVDAILDDLVRREVVKRNQTYYRILVGLFKEWLIANG